MLKRRRRILIAVIVLLVAAAIGFAIWVRKKGPPEAVRLLPEQEDGILFLNLKPLRIAGVLKQAKVPTNPEYEQFVRDTGFEFQRDLDQVAFAVHAATGPAQPMLLSEVFVGRFDAEKLRAYLARRAVSTEDYKENTIYTIQHEGGRVRITILGVDQVAASTLDGPADIHEIVDHYRAAALPRSGPALARAHYHDVPFGSLVWLIGKAGPEPGKGLELPLFGGLLGGATLVGSVRYTGSIHLRIDAFISDQQRAETLSKNLSAIVSVMSAGDDPDVKELLDSIKVEKKDERVVLSATVPEGFLQKLFTEPPPVPAASPTPTPTPEPKKRK